MYLFLGNPDEYSVQILLELCNVSGYHVDEPVITTNNIPLTLSEIAFELEFISSSTCVRKLI